MGGNLVKSILLEQFAHWVENVAEDTKLFFQPNSLIITISTKCSTV